MPVAMTFQEAGRMFPNAVVLEPKKEEPKAIQRVDNATYMKLAASIPGADKSGIRDASGGGSVPTNPVLAQSLKAQQTPASHLLVKVVQEFKLRLAQFHILPEGEKKTEFKIGLEAIGNFLVSCDPDILSVLEEVRETVTKPKFSLD
jgi:hypothetical protein